MTTKTSRSKRSNSAKPRKASPSPTQPETPPPLPIDYEKLVLKYLRSFSTQYEQGTPMSLTEGLDHLVKIALFEEALKQVSSWKFVELLLRVAYLEKSPMEVAPWLTEVGGYMEKKVAERMNENPTYWPIPLLELIAQTDDPYRFYQECDWYKTPADQDKAFRRFVSSQAVSPEGHHPALYRLLFEMFYRSSVIAAKAYGELTDEEKGQYMQGMIGMAKKGIYLKDFESMFKV